MRTSREKNVLVYHWRLCWNCTFEALLFMEMWRLNCKRCICEWRIREQQNCMSALRIKSAIGYVTSTELSLCSGRHWDWFLLERDGRVHTVVVLCYPRGIVFYSCMFLVFILVGGGWYCDFLFIEFFVFLNSILYSTEVHCIVTKSKVFSNSNGALWKYILYTCFICQRVHVALMDM